jgi:hypothetical protein
LAGHLEPLTPGEDALWQSMILVVKLIPRQLNSDLQRAANVTITEYDALRRLSQAPDRRLRMNELGSPFALLSQGPT